MIKNNGYAIGQRYLYSQYDSPNFAIVEIIEFCEDNFLILKALVSNVPGFQVGTWWKSYDIGDLTKSKVFGRDWYVLLKNQDKV